MAQSSDNANHLTFSEDGMEANADESRLWIISAFDKPGQLPVRMDNYDAHRAHLNAATIDIVMAGPTVADDGETPTGSFFVVRGSRAAAEAFHQADPFFKAGVWGRIEINQFLHRRGSAVVEQV